MPPDIIVVGAGIMGSTLTTIARERGYRVQLIDMGREADPLAGSPLALGHIALTHHPRGNPDRDHYVRSRAWYSSHDMLTSTQATIVAAPPRREGAKPKPPRQSPYHAVVDALSLLRRPDLVATVIGAGYRDTFLGTGQPHVGVNVALVDPALRPSANTVIQFAPAARAVIIAAGAGTGPLGGPQFLQYFAATATYRPERGTPEGERADCHVYTFGGRPLVTLVLTRSPGLWRISTVDRLSTNPDHALARLAGYLTRLPDTLNPEHTGAKWTLAAGRIVAPANTTRRFTRSDDRRIAWITGLGPHGVALAPSLALTALDKLGLTDKDTD